MFSDRQTSQVLGQSFTGNYVKLGIRKNKKVEFSHNFKALEFLQKGVKQESDDMCKTDDIMIMQLKMTKKQKISI